MPLVEVENLHKAYGPDTAVLAGASLTLERGETVSLVGPSGAGKSTLLAVLAGLLLPDRGDVRFAGESLIALDESGRARLRARAVGVVLQADNLIAFLTAAENVALAVELAGGDDPPGRARELLSRLGLSRRLDDYPRRLSGGEAQRAALAVALANEPAVLLADELTAQLDSVNASTVLDLILDESRERDLAVLLVTHSRDLARRADRGLRLADGRVSAA